MNENRKKIQLDLLMEKLRHKTNHFNLAECAKAFKMTILEKRYSNDSIEKSQYQKCLDLLQTNMKVTSLQSMLERLESISRQAGLKFTADASGTAFFISSDMFYLEIVVEPGGRVREVHIQHEGKSDPQTCNEIAVCLNSGNFTSFTSHLQGLCAIYQVSADKKLKSKAFAALSALESDLGAMSQLQNFIHDLPGLIHKSPLGILQQRIGGQPLTLTYFVSPYDLLNIQNQNVSQTLEKIIEKKLGLSCTVGIDSTSTTYKLPVTPLLSVTRNSDGESVSTFTSLNAANSAVLPATYLLHVRPPLILCRELANRIQAVTGVGIGSWESPECLLSMLMKNASSNQSDVANHPDSRQSTKSLTVTLPDQQHCYFVTENEEASMKCCVISSIPFSHPSHVPQILSCLRQQALLNTLLSTCVRPRNPTDQTPTLTFEMNSVSLDHLSISFEHPLLEQLCTADLDLSLDPTSIQCRLYGIEQEALANDEYATKVLRRCLSIPVTMRAILRQMQNSNRWPNIPGSSSHHGTFERRFHLDNPHGSTNGQFGSSSYSGGSGNAGGVGGFDGGHSPRTHSNESGPMMTQAEPMQGIIESNSIKSIPDEDSLKHRSGGDDDVQVEMMDTSGPSTVARSGLTPSSDDGSKNNIQSSNSSSTASIGRMKSSDSWLPIANPDMQSLFSLHASADSGVTLNYSSPGVLNPTGRRSSEDPISIKSSDSSSSVDFVDAVSLLQPPSVDDCPVIAEEADSGSPLTDGSMSLPKKDSAKSSVYPSVSITPVTSLHSTAQNSSNYSNMTLERRPGIEIIPLNNSKEGSVGAGPGGIPNSLTITPVMAAGGKPSKESQNGKGTKEFRGKDGRVFDAEDKPESNKDSRSEKTERDKESRDKNRDRDRDREKERERKERKRRREEEKQLAAAGGGKPAKMMCLGLSSTLMGPPGTILHSPSSNKTETSAGSSSKMSSKNSNVTSPLTPTAGGTSPVPGSVSTPPKLTNKVPTPSSSPKHPSSGGKPSMSALKSAASSLSGSTSLSPKPKKSKDRDRDRSDGKESRERDRDRDKDRSERERDRDRDRDRERDREKDRDKDRDKDKEKERERERDRDRDRDRDRERDRDKDKERERDRDKDRDRGDRSDKSDRGERSDKSEKDREKDKDRDRSKDREKKSRTPTPTSNHRATSGTGSIPLVKTKSLDFSFAIPVDENKADDADDPEILAFSCSNDVKRLGLELPPALSKSKESMSMSPSGSDAEVSKANCHSNATWPTEGLSSSGLSSGSGHKSPVRSRKSSLSAVIDKLRLQHNSEGDVSPTGTKSREMNNCGLSTGSKSERSDAGGKNLGFNKRFDLPGRTNFLNDLMEEDDSSSPKVSDEDGLHLDRSALELIAGSPNDPFGQEDGHQPNDSELERDSSGGGGKQFIRPFPPSRAAYGMRPYRTSDASSDINPHSPSVSVHIVNVPSPLSLQPTRSPLANQLVNIISAGGNGSGSDSGGISPQSSVSQASPCILDDDLMDEALVGLGK